MTRGPGAWLGTAGLGLSFCVALTVGCVGGGARSVIDSPSFYGRSVQDSLANGDFEDAADVAMRGLERFPQNGTTLWWAAVIELMRWRDVRALALLGRLRDAGEFGGVDRTELKGNIGDMLFRSGAYSDSVSYLNAGPRGPFAERRKAFVQLARELPYSRYQPPRIADELPLLEGSLPQLLCAVGDKQRPFVLDTGASMSALTRSLADELGVGSIIPAGRARDGLGSEFEVGVAVLDRLVVGTVQLDALPVLVLDDEILALRDPFGGPDAPPRGLVGLDILSRFRVTFDPARRSVLFETPRGIDLPRTVETVHHDGRCLVPVQVEGRRLWFVLDTGASHSSLTDTGLAQIPGAAQRTNVTNRRVRTPGGSHLAVREVSGLSLTVSAVRFDNVALPVIPRAGADLFPVHGVLGADLALRCRITFDGGSLIMEGL